MPNKVAIIVPFRALKEQKRTEQLNKFVPYMCNFLDNAGLDYNIFVIEQSDDGFKFNAGQTKNIGYNIAKKFNYDYYIFHDVDLLPNKDLMYGYQRFPDLPTGLAGVWDKYKYYPGTRERIPEFIGGIFSISPSDLEAANGYPNNHWGWSQDDKLLLFRLKKMNITVDVLEKGSLVEMKHVHGKSKREWENILFKSLEKDDEITWKYNGLYNLKYKILKKKIHLHKNCVKITVKLSDPDDMAEVNNNNINIFKHIKLLTTGYRFKLKTIPMTPLNPNIIISSFPAVYEKKYGFSEKQSIALQRFSQTYEHGYGWDIMTLICPYHLLHFRYPRIESENKSNYNKISQSPENYEYIKYFYTKNNIPAISYEYEYNEPLWLTYVDTFTRNELISYFSNYNKINILNIQQGYRDNLIINKEKNIFNINPNPFGIFRKKHGYKSDLSDKIYFCHPAIKNKIKKYQNKYDINNVIIENIFPSIEDLNNCLNKSNIKYDFINIHIDELNVITAFFKEQSILQRFLSRLLLAFKLQKKGGALLINSSYFRTEIGMQLQYLISNYYDEVYCERSILRAFVNGERLIIAKGFRGIDNNDYKILVELFKTWYEYDPNYTTSSNINNQTLKIVYPYIGNDLITKDYIHFYNMNKLNINRNRSNNFITNLLNVKLDDDWVKSVKKSNKIVSEMDWVYVSTALQIYFWWKWKAIDFPGSIDNLLTSAIESQIKQGLLWCTKFKIPINPIFNTKFKILKQTDSIKQIKSLKNKNIIFIIIPDLGIGNLFFIIASVYVYCLKNKLSLSLIVTNKSNYHISKDIEFNELSIFTMPNLTEFYLDYSEYRKYVNIEKISRKSLSPVYNYNYQEIELNKNKLPILLRASYFQSYKYFNKYKDNIKKLFEFTDSVKNYINNKYDEYNFDKIVALHIRHGDMLNEVINNSKIFYILSLSYYKNALKKFNKNFKILIFTGSAHLWINKKLIPYLVKNNYKYEIVKNNSHIMDLYLMTKCKNFILSNSTFSWWGAYLSYNPVNIYCPKYFLNPNYEQPDIILPGWNEVECSEKCYLKKRKEVLKYLFK